MDSPSSSTNETRGENAGGIFVSLINAFTSVRQYVGDLVDGFTRDLRRAGLALMWMVILGFFAAILLFTAWFGFIAASAFWLVFRGWTWAEALALIGGANLLVALIVAWIGAVLSRNLLFPNTRRQFKRKRK